MSSVGKDIFFADMRYFKAMYRRNPPWFRQMILEAVVFLGTHGRARRRSTGRSSCSTCFIPHQYAAWGIITMNLLQHDGCDEKSEYNHSRNFVGKLVNWFTYNNGYHTIHHMEPGLHWSLLPRPSTRSASRRSSTRTSISRRCSPTSCAPSAGPGKRVTYDGKPVVLPPEGPDEEWIPAPKETPADVSLGAIA